MGHVMPMEQLDLVQRCGEEGHRARAHNLKNLGMPGGGTADAHKENAQMRWNDHKDLCN